MARSRLIDSERRSSAVPEPLLTDDSVAPVVDQLDRNLGLIQLALCLMGIGIASYLTYTKLTATVIVCAIGGCETVNNSSYSRLFGIPVAYIGLAGYIGLLALLLLERRRPSDTILTLALIGGLIGVAFSAYLTWAEAFAIHAWCAWCVTSACTITVIFGLGLWRAIHRGTFG